MATETSHKFDEFLIDLRKYGFTILTGLITAGSFLGFSFSEKTGLESINSNILHLGVIYVTMFLVVILFWLDVYYQNLLYGSVLRSRFLEFFRLNYRLSVYISGLYTGSHMDNVLYLLYFGFLTGIFIMGLLVAGIIDQSIADNASNTLKSTRLSNFGDKLRPFIIWYDIYHFHWYQRKEKKINLHNGLFQEYLKKPKKELTNDKIMELENKITEHFPFEV
jgi:hypothetical protein